MTDEVIKKLGKAFAKVVPRVSFMLWEKKKFRKLIDFDNISQIEQDRIFNELEVTFLGLFYLYLDNLALQLQDEKEKEVIEKLKPALINGFLSIFSELAIEEKFVSGWKVLVDMRIEEYKKDFELLLKEGKDIKELKKDGKFRIFWARIQTITLDGLSHIRRGKLDEKDPLRKLLKDWVKEVDGIYSEAVKELIFKPIGRS